MPLTPSMDLYFSINSIQILIPSRDSSLDCSIRLIISSGIFGVEFFIGRKGEVIFSELSPRPHDTGMVTMFTQNFSQFDIHARVLLGMPLPEIKINQPGASHVILAEKNASGDFVIEGIEEALEDRSVDYRIFGKPFLKSYRRMGVVLAPTLEKAKKAANKIFVKAT